MGALERGLYVAHSGSSLRARIPDEAATFFAQNRKVGNSSSVTIMHDVQHRVKVLRCASQLFSGRSATCYCRNGIPAQRRSCIEAAEESGVMNIQVVDEWFVRIRGLLMRTSVAAGATHLTLAHAYARVIALAAQLRQLQRASAPVQPALAGDSSVPKLAVNSEEVTSTALHDCVKLFSMAF